MRGQGKAIETGMGLEGDMDGVYLYYNSTWNLGVGEGKWWFWGSRWRAAGVSAKPFRSHGGHRHFVRTEEGERTLPQSLPFRFAGGKEKMQGDRHAKNDAMTSEKHRRKPCPSVFTVRLPVRFASVTRPFPVRLRVRFTAARVTAGRGPSGARGHTGQVTASAGTAGTVRRAQAFRSK